MDIRKFFGSPPSRKTSSSQKVKETNNNNNIEKINVTKKNDKKEVVKNKEEKKRRESSEDQKRHDRKKSSESTEKKTSRKSSDDYTKINNKESKKRKASSDKESSNKKKLAEITLEDSDDEAFEEVVRKRRTKPGRKKGIVYDSDSEEDPIPSKSKRRSSDYQSVVIVDLDDESKKKSRPSPLKAFLKKTPAKPVAEVKKKVEEQAKRTPVSASDFFGGGSVKRVERKPASKRKLEDHSKTDNALDEEIHEDTDFEKTLAQLDEASQKSKKTKIENSSPPKKEVSPSKSSLSSKLSSLAKSAPIIVEDTPERKPSVPLRTSPRKSVSVNTPKKQQTPSKAETKKTSPEISGKSSAKTKTPSPGKSPVERKGSTGYRGYLNREGPRSLGSKEIPEGEANCLEGLTFVITGVLESFERDEAKSLLEKYGAKVTASLSKKTTYMVVGRDAGESKLNKSPRIMRRKTYSSSQSSQEKETVLQITPKPLSKQAKTVTFCSELETVDVDEPISTLPTISPSSTRKERTPRKEKPVTSTVTRSMLGLEVEDYPETAFLRPSDSPLTSARQVKNSNHMEPEGLERCLRDVTERGLTVDTLATDQHIMVTSNMKKHHKEAEQFKTKQLDEDGMLELIRSKPGKKSKYEIIAEAEMKKEKQKAQVASKRKSEEKLQAFKASPSKSVEKMESQSTSRIEEEVASADQSEPSLLWVDKYKPTNLKKVIGQTGDKSNANKLLQWMKCWHKNRALGKKPTGGFFGKDDGSGFRAALLSGPPGVGKTTTATLVCQEVGFSYVELNASDTRSKKKLEGLVAESLNNQTLVDFLGDHKKSSSGQSGKKHCIIMDEVDGVAGNEDRGGIQELIQLIKQTRIPIICICNDRTHPKMRSLVNYCFDLRFYKPRVEQIKGAMMSIVFREGLNIPPPALNEIILGANQDVRQVIHNLSMWCSTSKSLTYDQAKEDSQKAKKDLKIGPFDVCRKVFSGGEETAKMTLIDKSDLFFNDYSIAPLFVQENYIHVTPFCARGNVTRHLSQLAKAADSMCTGDLIEKKIRSGGKWNLLPMEAIFASVIPGEEMRGGISQMIAFPGWLGKNSSTNKHDRILQELNMHMSLHISSDKRGLNMDYLPYLRKSLTDPLVQKEGDGVKEVIELMDAYNILKEDFDNVMEVSKLPNSSDPFSSLSPKTKAAFTRAYNKESHLTPYAIGGATKKKKGRGGGDDEAGLLGEEGEGVADVEDEEDDDDMADGMIKMKKPKAGGKKAAAGKEKQTSDSKGKGRGKGKGKAKS